MLTLSSPLSRTKVPRVHQRLRRVVIEAEDEQPNDPDAVRLDELDGLLVLGNQALALAAQLLAIGGIDRLEADEQLVQVRISGQSQQVRVGADQHLGLGGPAAPEARARAP